MLTIAAGVFLGLLAFAALPFVLAFIVRTIEEHGRAVVTVLALVSIAIGVVILQPSTDQLRWLFEWLFTIFVIVAGMIGALAMIYWWIKSVVSLVRKTLR